MSVGLRERRFEMVTFGEALCFETIGGGHQRSVASVLNIHILGLTCATLKNPDTQQIDGCPQGLADVV